MIESLEVNSSVIMKKPHACGGSEWTVLYAGADIKIKCAACGRICMLPRDRFLRLCKTVKSPEQTNNSEET